jgi:hypothetical protein
MVHWWVLAHSGPYEAQNPFFSTYVRNKESWVFSIYYILYIVSLGIKTSEKKQTKIIATHK